LAGLAARQHGVVSFGQLRALGLSKGSVARRVEAGRLHPVHRGVFAVGHSGLSVEGAWLAAVFACGTGLRLAASGESHSATELRDVLDVWGAALSHRSAAAAWEMLPVTAGRVYVSIAGTVGRKRRVGLHLHRSRTLTAEAVTVHRGLPVTTPARTIADLRLAARIRGCPATVSRAELRRAIRQAEVLGLPTEAEGTTERTRSDLELAFLRLCRRHRLPRPQVNVPVGDLEVDFLWPARKLVVETDSYRFHRGRAAFEKDRDRDLRLRDLGYEVIRLTEAQVSSEAGRVAETLRTALR